MNKTKRLGSRCFTKMNDIGLTAISGAAHVDWLKPGCCTTCRINRVTKDLSADLTGNSWWSKPPACLETWVLGSLRSRLPFCALSCRRGFKRGLRAMPCVHAAALWKAGMWGPSATVAVLFRHLAAPGGNCGRDKTRLFGEFCVLREVYEPLFRFVFSKRWNHFALQPKPC